MEREAVVYRGTGSKRFAYDGQASLVEAHMPYRHLEVRVTDRAGKACAVLTDDDVLAFAEEIKHLRARGRK